MAKDSIVTGPVVPYETYRQNALNSDPPVLETVAEPSFIKDVNMKTQYNTKRLLHNETMEVRGIPHIFITTPMLNLTQENIDRDSYLSYLSTTQPDVLSMLSYGKGNFSTSSPFIKMLTNYAMSFDTKDSVSKTKEIGETFYGYKITIPGADVDSIVGDEVSIKYRDGSGLPVLNLHKAWFDYHNKVRRGLLAPSRDAILNHYLDYTSSIYFFLTEMDGTTLQYWCKLTGIVPINVPYSVFGGEWNSHELIEYTIQYVYSFKEDMDPSILLDFNKLNSDNKQGLEINYTEKETGSLVSAMTQNALSKEKRIYSPYEDNAKGKPLIVQGARKSDSDTGSKTGQSKFRLIYL